jgi:anti-sigma factor (TIGR02949 family)
MTERLEGGLWCHDVLSLLDQYIDGQLAAGDLAAVQAHVRVCEQCARFGGAYGRVVAAVRRGEATEPAPEQLQRLTARVLERLE